jgi:drug/metabolite transporter (DMT)-like permease
MNFSRRDYFFPLVLVVIGVFLLLRNLNLLDWLDGRYVWPIVLIILGVWLIVRRAKV